MTSKNHIYFVPGLAASPKIFEFLDLSGSNAEITYLDWLIPTSKKESIQSYAKRMCDRIKHPNPILIGVSFGGVMVQEMSKLIPCKKIFIISSIKTKNEMPKSLVITKKTRMYRLFPTRLLRKIDRLEKIKWGRRIQNRIKLYKKYLSMTDETYIPWAIYQVLHWNQTKPLQNIIHIHGDRDEVFPIKYIHSCEVVKGGTHVMIINKAKTIGQLIQSHL
ncbi:alpha/beta hydrolase [Flavobacteriaceae bacterium F08102]|nr:alpha/beta hydrolase [Flavobacteriaceae bacterium F08102]